MLDKPDMCRRRNKLKRNTSAQVAEERMDLDELVQLMDFQRGLDEEKLLAELQSEWARDQEIKDKSLLIKVGFQSGEFFQRILDEHPGHHLAAAVEAVGRAFWILESARQSLIDLAGRFHYRVMHDFVGQADRDADLLEATKQVYLYANAAESLVQAYRHLVSLDPDFAGPYASLKSELVTDKPIIRFIKDLRNHNNHINILEASPHCTVSQNFSSGTTSVSSGLRFSREAILSSDRWSCQSKSFVSDRVDLQVIELVNAHFELASEFYRKAPNRIGATSDWRFRDLQKLKVARQSMSYRHSLVIILQAALSKKLNPYEYLDRWFTPDEVRRIRAMPDHSKEQVDYLISLRDPLGLCDTTTRDQLYRLFLV